LGIEVKINRKVKGVGQECPTHTGNSNANVNDDPNVKSVGQECPTQGGASHTNIAEPPVFVCDE
jgi:hypothetical protein